MALHQTSTDILRSLKDHVRVELAHLVVVLDVEKIGGAPETWGLIQVTQVAPQIGVVNNASLVALEVAHINWVKPNQSCVQTHICLCDGGASKIALKRQDVLHLHKAKMDDIKFTGTIYYNHMLRYHSRLLLYPGVTMIPFQLP